MTRRAVFIEPHVRWDGSTTGQVVVHFENGLERIFRDEETALAYLDAGCMPRRDDRAPELLPYPNKEND